MDTLFLALRVAVSLAAVLGLLWYVQRRLTKGSVGQRSAGLVSVVGRQGIGQKASVVVVDVDGIRFVLGVTEQSVTVLHNTEQRNTEEIGIKIELPEGSPALNQGQGEPVDVADTCLFLASDLSRHVSGVEIYVDGGASLLR